MPTFEITAIRTLTGLPDGMRVEKGSQFIVNVPQTCTTPFASPAARSACMNVLKAAGFDFSENMNWLNSNNFSYKKP